jgi:hypothetical protein
VKLDLHGFHVVAKQGLREERHGRRRVSRAAVGGGEAREKVRVSSGGGRRRGEELVWEEDRVSSTTVDRGWREARV